MLAKKWPKEYYATRYECKLKHLRKSNPKHAKRNGVFGWRAFHTKSSSTDLTS